MSIPETTAAKVLIKSARHCCICRRFLPLHIQIHHIIELAYGGSNEEDNLIPMCIFCHSSVHTSPQMTRTFSAQELKGHRDAVYEMVEKGKLPVQAQITSGEMQVIAATLIQTLKNEGKDMKLSETAMQILLATACEEAPIKLKRHQDSFFLSVGSQNFILRSENGGRYPSELLELEQANYIDRDDMIAYISARGLAHVESLVGTTAKYVQKKVKCIDCSLHFTIHSWEPDGHKAKDLHCPECGQSDGHFIVWAQQKFGFIFEEVPGRAAVWDLSGLPLP